MAVRGKFPWRKALIMSFVVLYGSAGITGAWSRTLYRPPSHLPPVSV